MSSLAERAGARIRPGRRFSRPEGEVGRSEGHLARWAVAAIASVMALQALFLLVGCDWDLCGDEAEYWAWSRRLDWAYFSRGPVIAWVIRLGTALFGGLSRALTGSEMPAARMPAVLIGGLTAWGIFRLAEQATASRRAGLFAVLLLPAIPIFAIGGVVITSDTPLVCSWTWSALWALRAIRSGRLRHWAFAGLIGALGVLTKYVLLAMPASVGLLLLLSPRHRGQLLRPGFWAMATICAALGLGPIAIWNAHHGWVGAGQLADRVGLSDRAIWGGLTPVLSFLGAEVASLGVAWWFAGLAAIVGGLREVFRRPAGTDANDPDAREGTLYLLGLWGVTWMACLAASFLGETEANWMATGYVSLVVLIGRRAAEAFATGGLRPRLYASAWVVTVAGVVLLHHTEWSYPVLARYVPEPTKRFAAPLRLVDVTAKLRGHQELARAVARKVDSLRASGLDPFVVTPTYALASTLEFYLPGHPETYCLAWNYGMTARPVNQHDLWHPNPRTDPGPFVGRPMIVVEDANMSPSYATVLQHKGVVATAEPVERIAVQERGATVGVWDVTVCRDYRGIAHYRQNRPGARRRRPPAQAVDTPTGAR